MISTVVQHDHARLSAWRPVPAGRLLSPTPASVAAAFLLAAVLMEAPEQMFVYAQSSDTQGLCDTSGTVFWGGCSYYERTPVQCCDGMQCIEQIKINDGYHDCRDGSDETAVPFSQCAAEREGSPIETSCSADNVLCCSGERCIFPSWINNGRNECRDGSDETRPPFSQCAAEREASSIERRADVAVQCKPKCVWRKDAGYCQEVRLTEVPTFTNKDVTDIDVSGNSITILRAGAFQDLLKLTKIDLSGNAITFIEANAFSNLPQLMKIDLITNNIAFLDATEACAQISMQTIPGFMRWCNQGCDTSGTVVEVPGSCSLDYPVLCCDGEECINNGYDNDCRDGSDETRPSFSQCAAEREASPIETRAVVVVQCKPDCYGAEDYCQDYYYRNREREERERERLTEVPTFVNKDVTDIDLPGSTSGNADITIVRTGAFQDLLKLEKIELHYNTITLIEANAFSNLPQLTKIGLYGNKITLIEASAFSNLPQLTELRLHGNGNDITAHADAFDSLDALVTLLVEASFWQTAFVAKQCAQASSQTQTAAINFWCNQGCDTSGTVEVVEGSCSVDKPVLCCNGEQCIFRSRINSGYASCDDGSDETAVPFSQCAAEREASPIARTVVAVKCKRNCWDGGYCQEAVLTGVPTFLNKNVTEVDLSGQSTYSERGSITILRTGAFQDLLKLVKIDLWYNEITLIEANAFSNLPQLMTINLTSNAITSIEANAFSNLPQLIELDLSDYSITILRTGTFLNLLKLTKIDLAGNGITLIEANAFSTLPQLVTIDLSNNAIASIEANAFSNLPQLIELDLSDHSITILRTGTFQDLIKLVTLDLAGNGITLIEANAFSTLPQLVTIDLSNNAIASIEANAFSTLPQLVTIDLSSNAIISIEATAFSNLPQLTTLLLSDQAIDDAEQFALSKSEDVVQLCENTIISASDTLCVQNLEIPGEIAFLASAGVTSGLVGLNLIVQLHRNGGITCSDLLHVAFFTSRIFDLMTDWGMFGFTVQQDNWDDVMNPQNDPDYRYSTEWRSWKPIQYTRWADPVKYMSLISSIFGTLLFIPDMFVFARKLGLAKKLGGCFNWYKPTKKASRVIMALTLLLESIPQVICAIIIIVRYSAAGSIQAVIPAIVSAAMTLSTIFSDSVFFLRLADCCSCWCACCHCDVTDLFDNDELERVRAAAAPQRVINPAFRRGGHSSA